MKYLVPFYGYFLLHRETSMTRVKRLFMLLENIGLYVLVGVTAGVAGISPRWFFPLWCAVYTVFTLVEAVLMKLFPVAVLGWDRFRNRPLGEIYRSVFVVAITPMTLLAITYVATYLYGAGLS